MKKYLPMLIAVIIIIGFITYMVKFYLEFDSDNARAHDNRYAHLFIQTAQKYLNDSKDYELLGTYNRNSSKSLIAKMIYRGNDGKSVWVVNPICFNSKITLESDKKSEYGPYLSLDTKSAENPSHNFYVVVKRDSAGKHVIWAILSDSDDIAWNSKIDSLNKSYKEFLK